MVSALAKYHIFYFAFDLTSNSAGFTCFFLNSEPANCTISGELNFALPLVTNNEFISMGKLVSTVM